MHSKSPALLGCFFIANSRSPLKYTPISVYTYIGSCRLRGYSGDVCGVALCEVKPGGLHELALRAYATKFALGASEVYHVNPRNAPRAFRGIPM